MLGIYHAGELGVQARAGAQDEAQQSERVIKTTMKPVAQEFLHQKPMAFVASVDAEGGVWASVVAGLPGFMVAVDEGRIHIGAAPTWIVSSSKATMNPGVPATSEAHTHPSASMVATNAIGCCCKKSCATGFIVVLMTRSDCCASSWTPARA